MKSPVAKVIIITEAHGLERTGERRLVADKLENGAYATLDVLRDGQRIAAYQSDGWLAWREEGAEAPNSAQIALGIAKRALEQIANTVLERRDERQEIVSIARDTLEEIFAEIEL